MDKTAGSIQRRDEAFELTRTQLQRFIARRVESLETAEDLTQDVLLRLVNTDSHIDNLTAWLYRVARNVLIDHYRTRRADLPLNASSRLPPGLIDDPFAHDPLSAQRELAGCLRSLVDQLNEPYRSAVAAADLDGRTQTELARSTGLSISGMKSRVQRGRRQLHRMLTDCCPVQTGVDGSINDYQRNPGCRRDQGSKPPCVRHS